MFTQQLGVESGDASTNPMQEFHTSKSRGGAKLMLLFFSLFKIQPLVMWTASMDIGIVEELYSWKPSLNPLVFGSYYVFCCDLFAYLFF